MSGDERTIQVDYLARVEGEGALTLRTRDGEVQEVSLRIFEPPRFFEAFLRGRSALEVPDLTARICGICPVAYQMSSCLAIEDALGVAVPAELQRFRRLLYCGEWIESHVLHMVMLHVPDFLGMHDAMEMARSHGDRVRAGLRVKKAGNAIVRLLGGREIHPVNVRVGGFYRLPRREELRALGAELQACLPLALDLVRWMGSFTFPALQREPPFVALAPGGGTYPLMEGPLGCTVPMPPSGATRIEAADWRAHFAEHHVARSNALHGRMADGRAYLVGPQARLALNFEALPADLRALAAEIGVAPVERNPFRSLLVRGLEVLWALQEGAALCEELRSDGEAAAPVVLGPGVGHGWSEAPRGTLFHRYALDEQGLVTDALIVPPTSQNQPSIEDDLRAIAPELMAMELPAATARAEHVIRNYDPCISCSVHFLTLKREEA
jgi:sulfhydrogenase subunit alpha